MFSFKFCVKLFVYIFFAKLKKKKIDFNYENMTYMIKC